MSGFLAGSDADPFGKKMSVDRLGVTTTESKSQQYDALLADVSKKITKARVVRKLSMAKLAEAATLNVSIIFSIETGLHNISLVTLPKIAAALDMDIRDLMPGRPGTPSHDEAASGDEEA